MIYNIINTTTGGSGSGHIVRSLKPHMRPDVVFCPNGYSGPKITSLSDFPVKRHQELFYKRSKKFFMLDLNKTVEENMIMYLEKLRQTNKKVVLSGKISFVGNFFERNDFKPFIGLVRHPLHNMVSVLAHQHPAHVERLITKDEEGINTKAAAEYFAVRWNSIVSDDLKGGADIIRFEYAAKDILKTNMSDGDPLKKLFLNWKSSIRNYNILDKDIEKYLEELVAENYYKIYDKWDI